MGLNPKSESAQGMSPACRGRRGQTKIGEEQESFLGSDPHGNIKIAHLKWSQGKLGRYLEEIWTAARIYKAHTICSSRNTCQKPAKVCRGKKWGVLDCNFVFWCHFYLYFWASYLHMQKYKCCHCNNVRLFGDVFANSKSRTLTCSGFFLQLSETLIIVRNRRLQTNYVMMFVLESLQKFKSFQFLMSLYWGGRQICLSHSSVYFSK